MIRKKYLIPLLLLVLNLSVIDADYDDFAQFVRSQALNKTFVNAFKEHLKLFKGTSSPRLLGDFECDDIKNPSDGEKTVHNLTPMDIKVIGAMGDSLTAGTGIKAKTVIGLLNQYRGLSWSVGGDGSVDEYHTLPNIIKKFSPNLKGFSVNKGKVDSTNARLNVAVPGNKSRDMPGQARLLVQRMKEDTEIDMDNDWKIITVFIGGNDLCDYCDDPAQYSAETYMDNIQTALDILHESVPKAFVNLVEVLNIANVNQLNSNPICDVLHLRTCACGAYPKGDQEVMMRTAVKDYQEALHILTDSGRYDTRDDFTVVVQPFFRETEIPKELKSGDTDLSYFAPDCFHFSVKGQQAAATALWKNMMEPVGQKTKSWAPGESPICPSQDFPYFYTNQNSERNKKDKSQNQLGSQYNGQNPSVGQGPSDEPSSQGTPVTLAIVAAVGGVVILGLVISLVVIRRRRRNSESKHLLKSEITLPDVDA